jgi:protein-L-isoaspartate(D-aspartate) O-methyltransferase
MAYQDLVEYLIDGGVLKTPSLVKAMKKIDRKDFILPEFAGLEDADSPLPIYGGQTISQPTVVAFMLEQLEPRPGNKVLDIGSGSGWTTALLAEVVEPVGQVLGVEIIPELVALGKANLAKYKFQNVSVEQAGEKIGLPQKAPFDRILVSASGQSIPRELLDQLADGGIMVIPIEDSILKIEKGENGQFLVSQYPGFSFVPLRTD